MAPFSSREESSHPPQPEILECKFTVPLEQALSRTRAALKIFAYMMTDAG